MYQIHNMEEVHFSPSNSKTRYLWHYQNSLLCTLSRFHRWFCSVLSHINLPGIDMVDQNATFFNKKTPRSHFFLWASIRKTPSLTPSCWASIKKRPNSPSCWPHFCQRPVAVLDALPGLAKTQHMSFCMLLESPSAIQLGARCCAWGHVISEVQLGSALALQGMRAASLEQWERWGRRKGWNDVDMVVIDGMADDVAQNWAKLP